MGQVDQELLDDWERRQRADYLQRDVRKVVTLPCCGTGVEVEVQNLNDQQSIICPGCGKGNLLFWTVRPHIQSEGNDSLLVS